MAGDLAALRAALPHELSPAADRALADLLMRARD